MSTKRFYYRRLIWKVFHMYSCFLLLVLTVVDVGFVLSTFLLRCFKLSMSWFYIEVWSFRLPLNVRSYLPICLYQILILFPCLRIVNVFNLLLVWVFLSSCRITPLISSRLWPPSLLTKDCTVVFQNCKATLLLSVKFQGEVFFSFLLHFPPLFFFWLLRCLSFLFAFRFSV